MPGVCLLLLLAAASVRAEGDWGPLQFLVGQWAGEGGGGPGGAGSFSFAPDLQGKTLVRRNVAEYPAQNGKPAFRHDDLMIVYREAGTLRAIYFDSEAHVIRYTVQAVDGGAAFVSDTAGAGPRYRLTYLKDGGAAVKIRFEVAAPGKDFVTYIEARARRDP